MKWRGKEEDFHVNSTYCVLMGVSLQLRLQNNVSMLLIEVNWF